MDAAGGTSKLNLALCAGGPRAASPRACMHCTCMQLASSDLKRPTRTYIARYMCCARVVMPHLRRDVPSSTEQSGLKGRIVPVCTSSCIIHVGCVCTTHRAWNRCSIDGVVYTAGTLRACWRASARHQLWNSSACFSARPRGRVCSAKLMETRPWNLPAWACLRASNASESIDRIRPHARPPSRSRCTKPRACGISRACTACAGSYTYRQHRG